MLNKTEWTPIKIIQLIAVIILLIAIIVLTINLRNLSVLSKCLDYQTEALESLYNAKAHITDNYLLYQEDMVLADMYNNKTIQCLDKIWFQQWYSVQNVN